MQDFDIIIVGAGPSGCATALELTNLDPKLANRILLLDKAIFPRVKLCAGGVIKDADAVLRQLGVADFTEHKAGVYFESALAMDLGIEVIRTCRDTDLKNTHFHTRQYNHIVWRDELDLKDKLIVRIQATVPLKHQPRAVSN